MSSIWGDNIKISLFGESHSNSVGVNIDGLPPGFKIDLNIIKHQLFRRKSVNSSLTTPRKESDEFEILSGFFNGKTTGTPLCAIFKNKKFNSSYYKKNSYIPRPGTADFTASIRYSYNNDFRGAGHCSARLTLGLVFAGNICFQILKQKFGLYIGSHVSRLYNKSTKLFNKSNIATSLLNRLSLEYFPVIKKVDKRVFVNMIREFKKSGNSIGGEIETAVVGMPVGIGSPIFGNLESKISSLIFSIPAVKYVDFGSDITNIDGASAVDEFFYDHDNKVNIKSNNNHGILGGISSGSPIIFKTGFKPIASIFKTQNTINLETKTNSQITIIGNHDVSPVVRAAPVVEGVTAIALLDAVYDKY